MYLFMLPGADDNDNPPPPNLPPPPPPPLPLPVDEVNLYRKYFRCMGWLPPTLEEGPIPGVSPVAPPGGADRLAFWLDVLTPAGPPTRKRAASPSLLDERPSRPAPSFDGGLTRSFGLVVPSTLGTGSLTTTASLSSSVHLAQAREYLPRQPTTRLNTVECTVTSHYLHQANAFVWSVREAHTNAEEPLTLSSAIRQCASLAHLVRRIPPSSAPAGFDILRYSEEWDTLTEALRGPTASNLRGRFLTRYFVDTFTHLPGSNNIALQKVATHQDRLLLLAQQQAKEDAVLGSAPLHQGRQPSQSSTSDHNSRKPRKRPSGGATRFCPHCNYANPGRKHTPHPVTRLPSQAISRPAPCGEDQMPPDAPFNPTVPWVLPSGVPTPAPSVSSLLDMLDNTLQGSLHLDPATIPIPDSSRFVAGGVNSSRLDFWRRIVSASPPHTSSRILRWVSEGVSVSDFMVPFHGQFAAGTSLPLSPFHDISATILLPHPSNRLWMMRFRMNSAAVLAYWCVPFAMLLNTSSHCWFRPLGWSRRNPAAFFNVPLHPDSRRFFGSRIRMPDGVEWFITATVLVFGWSPSPFVAQELVFAVITYAWVENIEADRLSREDPSHEFTLSSHAFSKASGLLPHGTHLTLDAFASSSTTRCNRFISRFPEPGCLAVNFLSWFPLPSCTEVVYAYPPFALLLPTVQHLLRLKFPFLLIAPANFGTWWPLLSPSVTASVELGPKGDRSTVRGYDRLTKPLTWIPPTSQPGVWRWLLYGTTSHVSGPGKLNSASSRVFSKASIHPCTSWPRIHIMLSTNSLTRTTRLTLSFTGKHAHMPTPPVPAPALFVLATAKRVPLPQPVLMRVSLPTSPEQARHRFQPSLVGWIDGPISRFIPILLSRMRLMSFSGGVFRSLSSIHHAGPSRPFVHPGSSPSYSQPPCHGQRGTQGTSSSSPFPPASPLGTVAMVLLATHTGRRVGDLVRLRPSCCWWLPERLGILLTFTEHKTQHTSRYVMRAAVSRDPANGPHCPVAALHAYANEALLLGISLATSRYVFTKYAPHTWSPEVPANTDEINVSLALGFTLTGLKPRPLSGCRVANAISARNIGDIAAVMRRGGWASEDMAFRYSQVAITLEAMLSNSQSSEQAESSLSFWTQHYHEFRFFTN
ncbi:hypothetical protein BC829DRAFT_420247 [Chytridium lagenaria]|nr:hypothetical protein BC829DRAFT_420247 [Chytridium lagenaria]